MINNNKLCTKYRQEKVHPNYTTAFQNYMFHLLSMDKYKKNNDYK